jgi:uncharacterized membrane protein
MNDQPQSHEELKSAFHIKRRMFDDFSGWLTSVIGNPAFLVIHVLVFGTWVVLNAIPNSPFLFDPFPFMLLTTMVSLEAIFLTIIVLMSQNRDQRIADIRSKLDFEVDYRSEQEITKILTMLESIQDHLGIKSDEVDEDMIWMKKKTNLEELRREGRTRPVIHMTNTKNISAVLYTLGILFVLAVVVALLYLLDIQRNNLAYPQTEESRYLASLEIHSWEDVGPGTVSYAYFGEALPEKNCMRMNLWTGALKSQCRDSCDR